MKILGIDFTSAPGPRKAINVVHAELHGEDLAVASVDRWRQFSAFESAMTRPGPWIAGIDFPFGQSRRFIRNIGWPRAWESYVSHVARMTRDQFRTRLDDYRRDRVAGDKEHRRQVDQLAGAISPQKLYGVPVGLMFFEGAPRLLKSGVTIPGVHHGDPDRIVVEAYPGALARHLIGSRSYKHDTPERQSADQCEARKAIRDALRSERVLSTHGVRVHVDDEIADDPRADDLDALLCTVQAAAAWRNRDARYGAPADLDANEGWIAEPTIYERDSGV